MAGYYVTWSASGVTYVEANSKEDALLIFEHDPLDYVDQDAFVGEWAEVAP